MAEKMEFQELRTNEENDAEEVRYERSSGKFYVVKKTRLVCYIIFLVLLILIVLALGALVALILTETWLWAKDKGTESIIVPTSSPMPTTIGPEPYWQVRLPKNVIPNHYDVTLNIDLKDYKFSGNVEIAVDVTEPTPWILVHFKKMDITSAAVYKDGQSQKLETSEEFEFKKNEFYVFKMKKDLLPNKYKIKMAFKAVLSNTDVAGLYRTSYKHEDGKEMYIATTQMQPTDLRRTFPCFDEPAMKATFKTTIIHAPNLTAITNMPKEKTVGVENGLASTSFVKSPKMPTYLIAIVVCDFKYVEKNTPRGVKVRIYAPPAQIKQAEFALNVTVSILDYYEKVFNITYPLPKSDSIAVPNLSFGAMENWGLITYRDSRLLYDSNKSSGSDKQGIVAIVAHELAHQWFGNLVTMEWWNDLWLNEGFASYTEYIGMDHFRKEWKVMDQFVIIDLESAMNADSLVSSHPISVNVNHPDEINEMFDSISYQKGASVIWMMRYVLGQQVFNKGITDYLLKHQFGNAETKDLWASLSEASREAGTNIDVASVMDTWTLQMNFPVVTVQRIQGKSQAKVTQKRFLQDPNADVSKAKYTSPYDYKWFVPFTSIQGNKETTSKVLGTGNMVWLNMTETVDIAFDNTKWIKGNWGQSGYYRVNYDEENWNNLAKQLQKYHKALPSADRAGVILDAFSLAKAKLLKYSLALQMTVYMKDEDEYTPFHAVASSLKALAAMIPKSRPAYKNLQKYLEKQTVNKYTELGFNEKTEDDHLTKYLRKDVLDIMCGIGYKPCLDSCSKMFSDWMRKDVPIPADLSSLVYYYGIAQGSSEEWDYAFKVYQETAVPAQRKQLQHGLSGASEPWLISRYLEYTLDTSLIMSSQTIYIISVIANNNPIGRQLAWDFIRLNWDTIFERYGEGFVFRGLFTGVLGGFNTEFQLEQTEEFFKQHPDIGSGARALDQAFESIKSNIDWLKSNEEEVQTWLNNWLQSN